MPTYNDYRKPFAQRRKQRKQDRERQILEAHAQGMSVREIATSLDILPTKVYAFFASRGIYFGHSSEGGRRANLEERAYRNAPIGTPRY